MKTSSLASFLVAVPLAASAALSPADASASCTSRKPTVEAAVEDVIATYSPAVLGAGAGMCVAGIGSGGAIFKKCVGNRKSSWGSVNADTLFSIGSVTKTMTATLLALRASTPGTGVQLGDHVADYLGVTGLAMHPTAQSDITLLGLATHHSGLQRNEDEGWLPNPSSLSEFNGNVATCTWYQGPIDENAPVNCWDPARPYLYSNFGFHLLGNVLAADDGYATWAADNYASVMVPLSMDVTKTRRQYLGDPAFPSLAASGHAFDANGNIVTKPWYERPYWEEAGGSLYSSLDDMVLWLRYNLGSHGPQYLRDILPMVRTWRDDGKQPGDGIGLGWEIHIDTCEIPPGGGTSKRYWKGGAAAGNNAYITFDKQTNRGSVVLLNVDGDILDAEDVANKLIHKLP